MKRCVGEPRGGRASLPDELHAGLVEARVERVVGGYVDGHAVRVPLVDRQLAALQAAARHRPVETASLRRGCRTGAPDPVRG